MDYAPITRSGRELVLQISGATTAPSAMRFSKRDSVQELPEYGADSSIRFDSEAHRDQLGDV
jgi:hypothetical protein